MTPEIDPTDPSTIVRALQYENMMYLHELDEREACNCNNINTLNKGDSEDE